MVTMTQIAKECEVSQTTVSFVLNNRHDMVGEKTRDKVLDAAKKLGYRSNAAAVAMVTGRFNNIALLQSTFGPLSILPEGLLNGIQDAIADRGMNLMLSKLPDEKLADSGYVPKILSDIYADGLLVNYNASIPEKMIQLIHQHQIPAIWINSKQEANCIYPDDFDGGYNAARYLIELGHQRIGFLNYAGGTHYSGIDRLQGYEKAMREANLETFSINHEIFRIDTAEVSREFLTKSDRPTAVITYTEKETFGVYMAALSLGLKVPEDLSILAFGPSRIQHVDMIASTMILPERAVGLGAVEMLLKRIANPQLDLTPEPVKCHMEIGNTTGKPGKTQLWLE